MEEMRQNYECTVVKIIMTVDEGGHKTLGRSIKYETQQNIIMQDMRKMLRAHKRW